MAAIVAALAAPVAGHHMPAAQQSPMQKPNAAAELAAAASRFAPAEPLASAPASGQLDLFSRR
jgi:hypothetical protein